MTRYLIADVMLFDDELYEVSELGSPDSPIVLGAAASRCFATLLNAKGSIVTKKELLYDGWEQYGQQVSSNSVNQSIAQIRRCLAGTGHADYVVTVPRIGYKISDALSIERVGESQSFEKANSPDLDSVIAPQPVTPIEPLAVGHDRGGVGGSVYVCLIVLLCMNTTLAFVWNAMQLSTPLVAAIDFNYLPVPGVQNFHLFAAPGLSVNPERTTAHMLKLEKKPPLFTALSNYAYVYLNGALRDNVYSYFLCREPIEVSHTGCISYFVIDEVEQ